jgi:NADH-quinone oxidoreductase subunit A
MEPYFLPMFVFFCGGLLFIGLGFGFSLLLQTRKPNPEKLSFYECGEDAGPTGSRFNLRFFLPALVFVLMEVEIVLLAPVLLNRFDRTLGKTAEESEGLLRMEVLIFLLILGAGFMLALGKRYFDWQRPEGKTLSFQGPVPDFAYEQYNLDRQKKTSQGL